MVIRTYDVNLAWSTEDLGPAPIAAPPVSHSILTPLSAECYSAERKIKPNIVEVHVWIPHTTNGTFVEYERFGGVVINPAAGFVMTCRSVMASPMCNLKVLFADSIEVPAKRLYVHALGFAVIQYDPSLVESSIGSVTFSTRVPKTQDKITIYGPIINGDTCLMESTVISIGPLICPYMCEFFYYPINMDVLHFKKTYWGFGVLLDEDGDLQGVYLPFTVGVECVGVPLSLLMPAFKTLRNGILPPECRMLDVQLGVVHKNDAQAFGVPKGIPLPLKPAVLLLIHPKETVMAFPQRNLIRVAKVSCDHKNGLKAGDVIVKYGGNLVSKMSDLRDMFTHTTLRLSVIRGQAEVDVDALTVPTSSRQTDRVVWFAGAQFEPPYSPIPLMARKLQSDLCDRHW
jgi:hypothetical protein